MQYTVSESKASFSVRRLISTREDNVIFWFFEELLGVNRAIDRISASEHAILHQSHLKRVLEAIDALQ